jgi:hypothetical protein
MNTYELLKEPFSEKAVHWRVGQLTKDGTKGSALAYIDARDVMKRLDDVVGFENWSDDYYETKTGRLLCTLSIKIGDGWVSKSDGAGDTNIEGVKGGISDAFKRAAVKWGIGRYLYYLPVKWVAVENRRIVSPPSLPKWALPKSKSEKVADLSGWE